MEMSWKKYQETMLYDLNVPWPATNYKSQPSAEELTTLYNVIATLYTFGYTHIAINFIVNETVKIPINQPNLINPIKIDEIRAHFNEEKYPRFFIFTRLTLIVTDPSRCQNLSKLNNKFDIISVQPTTERSLQLAVSNLDIDLISINMSSRLPFFLKHKPLGNAIERGIKFEITYSNLIMGNAGYTNMLDLQNSSSSLIGRKNYFSNFLQIIRSSRLRGLIISSGCQLPLQIRNYNDILILFETFGLPINVGKKCFIENPENVLVSGRLRIKSFKQSIAIGNEAVPNSKEVLYTNKDDSNKASGSDSTKYKKKLEDTSSGRLLKKQRKGWRLEVHSKRVVNK